MVIIVIQYDSSEYEQMIALRMKVLRKPLGLIFSAQDLENEKEDVLIGAFLNEKLTGCCVLTKRDFHTLQLRQMAVEPAWQGKGMGTAIIDFAEQYAKENHYAVLTLHARAAAVPFYQKCGYVISGEKFTEVEIPHYKMHKHF